MHARGRVNQLSLRSPAREVFQKLSPTLEKCSGITIGEALSKVPEANLEMKKLKTEKKKIHRKLLTGAVKDVEAH